MFAANGIGYDDRAVVVPFRQPFIVDFVEPLRKVSVEPFPIDLGAIVAIAFEQDHVQIERHCVVLREIDIAERSQQQEEGAVFAREVNLFDRSFAVVHSQVDTDSIDQITDELRRNHIGENGVFPLGRVFGLGVPQPAFAAFTQIGNKGTLVIGIDDFADSALVPQFSR